MKSFKEINYKIIPNKNGDIYKIANLDIFSDFIKGDIYFSEVKPFSTKNWRKHTKLNCVIGVISGEVIIKLKSNLNDKTISKTLFLKKAKLIKIEAGCWYSFENKNDSNCLLFAMLNGKHEDKEVQRL